MGKIIIRVTIYPNHTNINFYIKFHEQEAHHKVVPAIDGGYDGDLEGTK